MDLRKLKSLSSLDYSRKSKIKLILLHPGNKVYKGVSKILFKRNQKGDLISEKQFDSQGKLLRTKRY